MKFLDRGMSYDFHNINGSFGEVEFQQVLHTAFPDFTDMLNLFPKSPFSHIPVTCYTKDIGMTICHRISKAHLCIALQIVVTLNVK